jgi:hypothetical protein
LQITGLSPKATSKPRSAFVDSALALDKLAQRLIKVLVLCCVPQNTGPFASRPVIDLVSRAKDHGGEWFGFPDRRISSQAQRPTSTVDCLTLIRPFHDGLENDAQITINRVGPDSCNDPNEQAAFYDLSFPRIISARSDDAIRTRSVW